MRWCGCRDSLDLTTPMDEHEAQTLADIDRFGWSLLKVSNGGHEYPALQLIFPDREHRWPWDDAATASFRETQPVLADIAVPLWAKK